MSIIEKQKACCNRMCPSYKPSTVHSSEFRKYLCQTCVQQYDKQLYCLYCQQIYYDHTDDGKQWIQCDQCFRWNHTDCAECHDIQGNGTSYKCIKCRKVQIQLPSTKRRMPHPIRGQPKISQKKADSFLNSIDFYWNLKPEQIVSDLEKIQLYLNYGTIKQ